MLSEERLAEIQKRADAATAGPWEEGWYRHTEMPEHTVRGVMVWERKKRGKRVPTKLIAAMVSYDSSNGELKGPMTAAEVEANVAFVRNSRTDIPDLLAEVRRLRAELATVSP